MATQEIQTVLVEIVPAERSRTPAGVFRDSQVGRNHGCRQSHLGSAAHPRRIAETRFETSERTVSRLMPKKDRKPTQTWTTFLRNHVGQLVSIDFFTVATIRLRVLYIFIVLAHDRRRVIHFNITEHPTAVWAVQQVIEAFPEDRAPRFIVRDRDGMYGE